MKTHEVIDELMRFREILSNADIGMSFDAIAVQSPNRPFKTWFREEVPGENASKRSGVYFIADLEDTVIYIGKATVGNLAAEIWQKFSAATDLDENDIPTFGNSSLAQWASEEKYRAMLSCGNILIRAVVIEPKEFASLAEVYLHTWCARNGGLPTLNKRIG